MTVALAAAVIISRSDDDGHVDPKIKNTKKGQQCTPFNARIWFYISKLQPLLLSSFD
jgi:hypothetical protein